MTDMEIFQRRDVALPIVLAAADTALRFFRDIDSLKIEQKGFQDLVSDADRGVEQDIRNALQEALPQDGIIGEEHGIKESQSGYTWVIDPIDGTANFVRGTPGWCVVLACVKDDQTVLGIIKDPVADETWIAVRGSGVTLNERAIRVSTSSGLDNGSTGVGISHRVPMELTLKALGAIVADGGIFYRNASGALMLAYVASGRLIGYCETHMNSWDCIAGLLMIEEAGGQVEAFDMSTMLAEGNRVIAACPGVYDQLYGHCVSAYS